MKRRLVHPTRLSGEQLEVRALLTTMLLEPLVEVVEDQPPTSVAPNAHVLDVGNFIPRGAILRVRIEDALSTDYLSVSNKDSGEGSLQQRNGVDLFFGGENFAVYNRFSAPPGDRYVYKSVGQRELSAYVLRPPDSSAGPRPAIVLFHGGGWRSGVGMHRHAELLATQGFVTMVIEYRFVDLAVAEPPIAAMQDAKSAIRWVRANATELGVDPDRIAAMGSSAGGHLSAVTGMIDGIDDPNDDLTISAKTNAVVLISAVVNNGPGQFGHERIGDAYPHLSPAHNISSDDPPTIAFAGEADTLVRPEVFRDMQTAMDAAGVRFDLHTYPGGRHAFAQAQWDNANFYDVLQKTVDFLDSLGWIEKGQPLAMPDAAPPPKPLSFLTVHFSSNTTHEAIEAVLRNIAFQAVYASTGVSHRTLTFELYNGGSGELLDRKQQVVQIQSVNDAPRLRATDPFIAGTQQEDDFHPMGFHIEHLLVGRVDDSDDDPQYGIAIVAADSIVGGAWQYSRDTGHTWTPLDEVAYHRALLLPADGATMLRFVPPPDFAGQASLRYRAWDQTQGNAEERFNINSTGNGGQSAFSPQPQTASILVENVNDAPVLNPSRTPPLRTIAEDSRNSYGTPIWELLPGISDVDSDAARGIAVVAAQTASGTWQFTLDNGARWKALGGVSESVARLLPANGPHSRLRFVPRTDFFGETQIAYYAWDQTEGEAGGTRGIANLSRRGGTTAFSIEGRTATLRVYAVNDAPKLGLSGTLGYRRNTSPIAIAPNATVSDVDNTHFGGGFLQVAVLTGNSATNRLALGSEFVVRSVQGQQRVMFNGVHIGTLTHDGVGVNALRIQLTNRATLDITQRLVRSITFQTVDDTSTELTNRAISFLLNDGKPGGDSLQRTKTIVMRR